MIYIKGDIHGEIDMNDLSSSKFPEGKELTKKDYVIICGDFGAGFDIDYCLKWLRMKNFSTLFIRGNHDNPELLNSLETVQMFDNYVSKLSDNIYWLHDGEIYNIEGRYFFTFGGAMSSDKEWRKQGIDWWPEEVPTQSLYRLAYENLSNSNWEVDFVLTHTAPSNIIKEIYSNYGIGKMVHSEPRYNDPTCKMLDSFQEKIKFSKWFFGHMHEDGYFGPDKNYIGTYHKIHKII